MDAMLAAERDASITFSVIRNREGFVRYLLLLLPGDGEDLGATGVFRFESGDGAGPAAGR